MPSVSRIHNVDIPHLKNTLKALVLYHKKAKEAAAKDSTKKSKILFDEDPTISLQIDFCMKPNLKNKSFFFDVEKSPIYDKEMSEICLIVKDDKNFQKKYEKAKYDQRDRQTQNFKAIHNAVAVVLPYSVVKSDFRTHEEKRILCNTYDFFVADRDLMDKLPSVLGSHFIKSKKIPRKVANLNEENPNIAEILDKKLSQAVWQVDGRGTCTNIVIGNVNPEHFTLDQLTKNAEQCLEQIAKEGPRGWNFIKSVHVRLERSVALDVYKKGESVEVPQDLDQIEVKNVEKQELLDSKLFQSYVKMISEKTKGGKKRNNNNNKRKLGNKTEAVKDVIVTIGEKIDGVDQDEVSPKKKVKSS